MIYSVDGCHGKLQEDLGKLEEWAKKWDMEFNTIKSEHILFTRKRKPSIHRFHLNGTPIPAVDTVKYLGVTLDSKLTFHSHIENTTHKANSVLGLVRRNLTTTSTDVKASSYKTLVRPS
jgi:hypothetical protein